MTSVSIGDTNWADKHREARPNVAACQLDDAKTTRLEMNLQSIAGLTETESKLKGELQIRQLYEKFDELGGASRADPVRIQQQQIKLLQPLVSKPYTQA